MAAPLTAAAIPPVHRCKPLMTSAKPISSIELRVASVYGPNVGPPISTVGGCSEMSVSTRRPIANRRAVIGNQRNVDSRLSIEAPKAILRARGSCIPEATRANPTQVTAKAVGNPTA
jgi:hypothetical protein